MTYPKTPHRSRSKGEVGAEPVGVLTRLRTDPIAAFAISAAILSTCVYLFAALQADSGEEIAAIIVLVPVASAVIAWRISGHPIRWGRPSRWLALSAAFPLTAGVTYSATAATGQLELVSWPNPVDVIAGSITTAVIILTEEVGWRGYLLPYLRQRTGFWTANAVVAGAWWLFHIPLILIGGGRIYGTPGQPLLQQIGFFTIGVVAGSFFVGAVWERNHDVWGAALTHGIWNTTVTGTWVATFSGPEWLLDEFGLLAPATVAVVALVLVPFLVSGVPAARRPLSS